MSRRAFTAKRRMVSGPARVDAEPVNAVDLRAIWPSLSSERRDSLIGDALGVAPTIKYGTRSLESGLFTKWDDTREDAEDFFVRHPALVGRYEIVEREFWPLYSETWGGFGKIMEECVRRQWPASLVHRGVAPAMVYATVKGCHSDECATGPEALALAFSLAVGVVAPAEWAEEGA